MSRKRKLRGGKIIIDRKRRKGIPLIYFERTQLPLNLAACRNNYYFVERLLKHGAKPNKKDKLSVLTPLSWAAHNGNLEMVKLLLGKGAEINAAHKDWMTSPLIEAIEWRHWAVAKYLVETGVDITTKDRKGKTALAHAAIQKNFELAKILIEKGANVNNVDNDGVCILEDACSGDVLFAETKTNLELLKLLIDNGAQTNKRAINTVVRKGEFEPAKYLLSKQAPLSGELLLNAANGLNFDLFKYLFDSLQLRNVAYDSSGFLMTGILFGVCSGYWTNGANRGVNISMLEYILERGPGITRINDKGQNIFTVLVEYGKPDSVTLQVAQLLIRKSNTFELDRSGIFDYPLKLASYDGLLETARLFIENGADVNHSGDDGGTILHQACWKYDNEKIIKLLGERGAEINRQNNRGETPIMGCTYFNRTENIKTLADLGADLNKKTKTGHTLLDLVGDAETRKYLIQKGAVSGKE